MKGRAAKGKRPERRSSAGAAAVSPSREALPLRVMRYISGWPRLARIVLVAALALVVTVAFSPLVDWVYLSFFFDESTTIVPSLISTGAGVVMYLVGWVLLVGTVGEPPVVRRATFVYLLVGLLAVLLVIYLIVTGYSIAVEPL